MSRFEGEAHPDHAGHRASPPTAPGGPGWTGEPPPGPGAGRRGAVPSRRRARRPRPRVPRRARPCRPRAPSSQRRYRGRGIPGARGRAARGATTPRPMPPPAQHRRRRRPARLSARHRQPLPVPPLVPAGLGGPRRPSAISREIAWTPISSATRPAMTPKAPKATDSGLLASSTWATTREVALNRKSAPGLLALTNSCFNGGYITAAVVELYPVQSGRPGASVTWPPGETAAHSPDQRRAEDQNPLAAVNVVLHYLAG